MSNEISVFKALKRRAELIAGHCAPRLPVPTAWEGYTSDETLTGELRYQGLVAYWRVAKPQAVLVFRDPVMNDMKNVDWGEEQVVQSNVVEKYSNKILFEKEIDYKEEISHTFSKTRTLLEQAKVAAEEAVRGLASVEESGIKVELEVSVKLQEEYSRQWGETDTQSDTVTRDVEIKGPIALTYEATREIDKTQRLITAQTDFSHDVELIDETGAGEAPPLIHIFWRSWPEFLAVAKGLAPSHHEDGQPTGLYRGFMDNPLSDSELEELEQPTKGNISFLAEYDNVIRQDIKVI